jgi:hypothetical protein
MKLTWRDGVATALMVGAVAVALAVTQGWNWTLLGSTKAGVAAVAVIGYMMCRLGMHWITDAKDMVRGPVLIAASVLGVGALVLIVAGLIVGTEALLVALTINIVALWFITTWRHAVVGVPGQPSGHELQAWDPRLIAIRSPPDGPLANAGPVWDHPWTACDPPWR